MPSHQTRALLLLGQAHALQTFAARLQPDRNESSLLVHEALMVAFAQPVAHRGSLDAGRELRRSLVGGLRLKRRASPSAAPRTAEAFAR